MLQEVTRVHCDTTERSCKEYNTETEKYYIDKIVITSNIDIVILTTASWAIINISSTFACNSLRPSDAYMHQ